jgi:hypothetical protein
LLSLSLYPPLSLCLYLSLDSAASLSLLVRKEEPEKAMQIESEKNESKWEI